MDLQNFIESIGYLGLAAVVFSESGLLIGAFFPGDSLLFTAGFLASQHIFDIRILVPLCFLAAVFGDSVGYTFGRKLGPKIFTREDSLLFHRDHLERSRRFYERHGGKTIILARFMPIVRTFAPILAGVGRMQYRQFLFYNVVGALLWAAGISYMGYLLGDTIPGVDRYLIPIILLIILTSVAPTAFHVLRNPAQRRSFIAAIKKFLRIAPKKISPDPHYRNTSLEGTNITPLGSYQAEAGKELVRRFGSKEWFARAVPLSLKTTFRLGGPADYFVTPKTLEDIQTICTACRELNIPLFILGGGSNILFSDQGWRGVVLQLANNDITIGVKSKEQPLLADVGNTPDKDAARWSHSNENRPTPPQKPNAPSTLPLVEVRAGAGTSLQQLVLKTHQAKLVGLESFFGIPARVGGALRNNVHGGSDNFGRYVKEVTVFNRRTGITEIWPHDRFAFSYDRSILQHQKDWLVWEVTLQLPKADDLLWQEFNEYFNAWQRYKNTTQTAAGTAGCTFKNIPPQDAAAHHVPISAGANIDRFIGLSTTLRTAQISSFHGNFLQSTGTVQATAEDVLSLINFIREEIVKKTGIHLEPEIEFVGF
ncbi:MAG: VTT domain-containing protein [Patescibacteria group bacterium]